MGRQTATVGHTHICVQGFTVGGIEQVVMTTLEMTIDPLYKALLFASIKVAHRHTVTSSLTVYVLNKCFKLEFLSAVLQALMQWSTIACLMTCKFELDRR